MHKHLSATSLGLLMILISSAVQAGPLLDKTSQQGRQGMLLSQVEADQTYDPFADFSEFEMSSEEEADINFFRNGRLFNLGFIGGYRRPTETLGEIYEDGPVFGVFLSYFFDMRFALQIAFYTGDHTLAFNTPSGDKIRGNISLSNVAANLKYYINTQNITRGLAQLNPYLIGGFSHVMRTSTVAGESAFAKDSATGFDMGAGIEIPLLRNKMYFGTQITYQLVNFKDENTEIVVSGTQPTGIYPTGDLIDLFLILGINF